MIRLSEILNSEIIFSLTSQIEKRVLALNTMLLRVYRMISNKEKMPSSNKNQSRTRLANSTIGPHVALNQDVKEASPACPPSCIADGSCTRKP